MKKLCVLFVLLILLINTYGFSQIIEKNLNKRDYEAVVTKMTNFSQFFGSSLTEMFLYAYDSDLSVWRAVPFQIDHRNQNGTYFGGETGLLDANDELVFMAVDMGDRVPDGYWLANQDSRNTLRFEVEVHDTLRMGQKGWVYLFLSNSISDFLPENYLDYNPASDQIESKYYTVAFNPANGLPWHFFITADGGGANIDILDRLKLRFKIRASAFGIYNKDLVISEDNIFKQTPVQFVDKNVRVIRNMRTTLRVNTGIPGFDTYELNDVYMPIYFYPYNMNIQTDEIDLNPDNLPNGVSVRIQLIRNSLDFNANSNGMRFYNWKNKVDTGNLNLINGMGQGNLANYSLEVPGLNWFLISGSPGSIFSTTTVPDIGDGQALYFWDYNYPDNPTTQDGTSDTGDMRSWGDSGVRIVGSDIRGGFSFLNNTFFLPANQTFEIGDTLNKNIKSPVEVNVFPQPYDIIPPAKINIIAASPESDSAISLTWIAPGDDSSSGTANRYEVGYSSVAPEEGQEELWFNSVATIVGDLPEPQNAGSQESWILNGLNPATNYFLAVKAYDESNNGSGNASLISNIITSLSLDVELVSFTAEVVLNSVTLYWHTASEDNNLGFELQRKKEGQYYEAIGFVPGNGTTAESHYYSFTDVEIPAGLYYYRLKQLDLNGSSVFHAEIQLTIAPPLEFALHQNFPNPFNPTTTLAYDLAADVPVKLVIYNTKGQVVKIVVNGKRTAGRYRVLIDGSLWPSGIYFVRLTAGMAIFVKKIILLE